MAASSPGTSESETPAHEPAEKTEGKPLAGVDLQDLAEKVYGLLKEELRTERDRLGRGHW